MEPSKIRAFFTTMDSIQEANGNVESREASPADDIAKLPNVTEWIGRRCRGELRGLRKIMKREFYGMF